jgi:Uma2 family endonuclease
VIEYAPILCVEILSPEDRLTAMRNKIDDYAQLGVKSIWVIDPEKRVGYYASSAGLDQSSDGVMRVSGTEIMISLAHVFAELDES